MKKRAHILHESPRLKKIIKQVDKFIQTRIYSANMQEKELFEMIKEYEKIPDFPKFSEKRRIMNDDIENRKIKLSMYWV